jgi:hypothetical protein
MARSNSRKRRISQHYSAPIDAETGVYRRPPPVDRKGLFPPPLSDQEILDIVDDLTESLLDW